MRKNPLAAAAAFSFFWLAASALAEDFGSTARGLFALMPTSFFESTAEGLSEGEKQALLRDGASEFWEIAREDSDALVLSALPLRERAVGLRVFRNHQDGSTLAAIGSLGDEQCVLELWRQDVSGRLVPADAPEEPDISEFLDRRSRLPRGVAPAVFVCLDEEGLAARPIFWRGDRQLRLPLARSIRYEWTGSGFEKRVSQAGAPAAPASAP